MAGVVIPDYPQTPMLAARLARIFAARVVRGGSRSE